ncbi:MAG: flavodoxin family protein [Christensenella sp.]|nr:flavodoxin family protein [Christensenella sp.]
MKDRKKIIIHDLPHNLATAMFEFLSDDYIIIDANIKAAKCIGCFECWLKNPGVCTFADELENVGQLVFSSKKLIIITEMLYGGVSIPVKKVLDRSIPGITPFFKKRKGQLHHLQRYQSETEINAVFYNSDHLSASEKAQGEEYIEAMGLNFYSKHNEVLFINGADLSEIVI